MSGFNLGTAQGQITIDGGGAQAGFNVARGAANVFFDAIQSKVDRVERLGDRLTKVGAAGVGGFGIAVKAASGFEYQMSAVQAVSGATTKEMDTLRKKALQLGADTSFSASEAGSAMEELVKAGLSVEDVLNGAADATVALAAAGEISLPEAATIASNAMNQFSLSAKELPRVADLIAGAANASAIDVGDFGFSLSQAGAVAHLTGMSFEDLTVAIAEMGNAGIKGSDAGTSLKTFLSNLIPTTDQQIALFEKLGLFTIDLSSHMKELGEKGIKPTSNKFTDIVDAFGKYIDKSGGAAEGTAKNRKQALALGQEMGVLNNAFFDSTGKVKKLSDVQGVLQDALKGLTKEQKLNTLNTLFGSDAIRAAAVLADNGSKGYDKMAKSINKIKAADVAATRLNNLKGSVEQLKGAFETMQIILGNVFLPIIRKFVDGVTSMVNIFNELPPGVQKAIAVFLGVGSAMSLATGLAIKLAFVLGPLLTHMLGLRAISAVFGIFRTGFAVWRGGAGAAAALAASGSRAALIYTRVTRAVQAFIVWGRRFVVLSRVMGAAWAFITGPIGLTIAAIVLLGVILYKTFKPFRDLVDGVGRAIKEGFLASIEFVKQAWASVVAGFNGAGTATSGFMKAMQTLGSYVRIVWDVFAALTRWFISNLMPVLKQAGDQIMNSLGKAWKDISATVSSTLLPALQRLGETFTGTVLPALQKLWTAIQPLMPAFKMMGIVIAVALIAPFVALYAILVTLIPLIISVGAAIISGFVDVVVTAVKAVITWISGFIDVISGMIKVFVGLFTGDWKKMWEGIKQITSGAWKMIQGIFQATVGVLISVVKGTVNAIIQFFKTLYDVLVGHSIIPDLVKAIIKWFTGMPGVLLGIVSRMVTSLINWFVNLFRTVNSRVSAGITAVVNWFRQLPGRTLSAIASLVGSLLRVANSWGTTVKNAVVGKFNDVISWFRSLPGRIRNALGSMGGILRSAGVSLIKGLLNGITSMFGSVKSTLGGLTSKLTDWKGPKKLDKVILTGNGELIMRGLIEGFKKEEPNVKDFLNRLTVALPKDMNRAYTASASAAETARSKARDYRQDAANRMFGESKKIETNIYNPSAEQASNSVAKRLRTLSSAGVI